MNELIKEIQKSINYQFNEIRQHFYEISGTSNALNSHNNDIRPIRVANLSDDYWIYLTLTFSVISLDAVPERNPERQNFLDTLGEIHLRVNESFYSVNVSVSVFQGAPEDDSKTQLFRAEWDNYDEAGSDHPQPHWHFYPFKHDLPVGLKNAEDWEALAELARTEFHFESQVENGEKPTRPNLDIKRFHFAMNGQWSTGGPTVHKINSIDVLRNWLEGLLLNIRRQLDFCSRSGNAS